MQEFSHILDNNIPFIGCVTLFFYFKILFLISNTLWESMFNWFYLRRFDLCKFRIFILWNSCFIFLWSVGYSPFFSIELIACHSLLALLDDCIEADTRQATKANQKYRNKNVSIFETCRYNQAIIWNFMAFWMVFQWGNNVYILPLSTLAAHSTTIYTLYQSEMVFLLQTSHSHTFFIWVFDERHDKRCNDNICVLFQHEQVSLFFICVYVCVCVIFGRSVGLSFDCRVL